MTTLNSRGVASGGCEHRASAFRSDPIGMERISVQQIFLVVYNFTFSHFLLRGSAFRLKMPSDRTPPFFADQNSP